MRQAVICYLLLLILRSNHAVRSLKGPNTILLFNDSQNKTTKAIDLSIGTFTAKAKIYHFGIVTPASLDYLPEEDRVYYSDIRQGMILSVFSNATSLKVLFSCNVVKPLGLVIDKPGRNIFWTDVGTKRIEVGSMDGKKRKVLIESGIDGPAAIVLDIPRGLLFWTDIGKNPKIEEAAMDGSNRRVIVSENLGTPTGITIDPSSSRLFWIDAKLDRIEEFSLKTSKRKVLLSLKRGVSGYGLTIHQSWLYWSEWQTKSISRVSANGGNVEIMVTGLMKPMDILVYDTASTISSSCSLKNGLCSDFCLLSPTGYRCACPAGVPLLPDRKTCDHDFFNEASSDNFLLIAGSYSAKIYKIPLEETTDKPCNYLDIKGTIAYPIALDYDPLEGIVYWTDGRAKVIVRATLDGSSVEVIVRENIQSPDGIAVDWIARNIYWSDAGTQRIEVSRLDGSSRRSLITTDIEKPRAIALNFAGSTLFWSDWGSTPKIERTNMDGTGRIVLVNFKYAWVNAISLDIEKGHLYWFDARMKRVERIDFDGKNRQFIVSFRFVINLHPFALVVRRDILYWTDWSRKGVIRYNYTSHRGELVWKGLARPMGLHLHDSQKMYQGSSKCSHLNGGCSNLCLPHPDDRRCFCPEGVRFVPGDPYTCEGAVKCPSLPTPANGIRQGCQGNTTEEYLTTCTFSCSTGYYGSGSNVRKCLRNSSWSGHEFTCQAVRCGPLKVPLNAVLVTPFCGKTFGANCVLGCQYGYATRNGNVTRSCSPLGKWIGQVINCQDILPPSFGSTCPAKPYLVFPRMNEISAVVNWMVPAAKDNSGNPPVMQTNFKYPPQRLREGTHLIIYTATDISGNKATCSILINVTVIYCKRLSIRPEGPLRVNDCGHHNGAHCLFSCAVGYRLRGSSTSKCIAPDERSSGIWSNPPPSCEAIKCQSVPSPTNGRKTGCSGNATEVYGVRCSFTCNVGFRLFGSSSRYCLDNGTWSGQNSTCKAIECEALVPAQYGTVSPSSCLKRSIFGHECSFSCYEGFTLEGTASRVCSFFGNWTGKNDTTCKDFTPPTFNDSCPGNLAFHTDACQDRATVSWQDPVATDNSPAVTVKLPTIRPPVKLIVGLYEILYTAEDTSGNSANCSFVVQVARISCPKLQPPLDGTISSTSCESFMGSTALFACNVGYQLAGSRTRSCQSNGTWSGNATFCNIVKCPAIKLPVHGDVSPQVCKSVSGVQYKTRCFLTCDSLNGYKLEGPQNVSCEENGLWSPDKMETICKDIQPPQIQCPSNIVVDAETNRSYAKVSWTVPVPTDNSNIPTRPIGLYPPQKIKAGRTEIIYDATDSSGLSAQCRFTIQVKDTQPPRFLSYPSNMQIVSGKRWNKIALPPSYHTDNVGVVLFTTSIRNGSELQWGEYKVIYIISDKAGNTANCTFHINIAGSSCEDLPAPLNGAKACETWLVGMHCTVHCNKGYGFATDPQQLYFCTPTGRWVNAKVKGNEKPHLPDCTKKQNPTDVRVEGRVQYHTNKCDGEESKKVVAKEFIALFKQHPIGLFGGCLRNDKCKIENVRVECGTRTRTRKRRGTFKTKKTPITYIQVQFTVTVPLTNTSNQELNKTTKEISQNFRSDLENMDLDLNISGVEMRLDKSTPPVIAIQDYVCDKGQVKIKSHCVNCPMGHFYNDKEGVCQKCPADYYQDKEAKPSCVPCPNGTTTLGQEASKSRKECLESCQAGYFYDFDKASCQKCPVNHYQDHKAQVTCIPCPKGTYTRGAEASKSRHDCHDKRCFVKKPPRNGAIACTTWSMGRYCTPFCSIGWDFTRPMRAFGVWFCNERGMWLSRHWPDCSIPYKPNTFKMAGGMYYYSGDCRTPEVMSQIQQRFIQVLNSSVFRMVCQLPTFRDKCKAENVDVECINDDSSTYTKTQKTEK
ncbi:sushi, von Willebrand factor type A, EGF and pentraxin domain-containing protein 1-like isoform X3 [Stylophora pistillata]|uniref:Low-density lipoprotein receptor-related protein 5 n=2 Tax=Stylophora pistillata TaxID=50429 RepID=A0A2B4S4T4_STYPI|nr:sushi, von Willebrand factor type A, EGF and pentraxin domain-containing protein 1-like isoform X3 [Stylophora pistillata]PFX24406.1 Low-density lipoprotein receptor-related protein 5 [Stylophora pistillata]